MAFCYLRNVVSPLLLFRTPACPGTASFAIVVHAAVAAIWAAGAVVSRLSLCAPLIGLVHMIHAAHSSPRAPNCPLLDSRAEDKGCPRPAGKRGASWAPTQARFSARVGDPARSCLRACLCLPLPPWLVLAAGIRLLNFHKGKRQQSTLTKDNLANCSGRTTTYSRETFYSISEITIPGSRESGSQTAPASPRCATGADLSS